MAKIVKASGEAFDFSFTSTEKFTITPEGVQVPDEVAAVMASRFAVTIEDVASEAAPAVEDAAPAQEAVVETPVPAEVEASADTTSSDASAQAGAQE